MGALEGYLDAAEAEQETPLIHRVAKAGLAAVAAIAASWMIERTYDNFVNGRNEEDNNDASDDIQE